MHLLRLTIFSIVHVGLAASGVAETQLSMEYPPLEVDPPQAKTVSGAVKGAYCGSATIDPCNWYVRPPNGSFTAPGKFGSVLIVAKVFSSKILASL
jgi:hypothetical protein